ncbi:MULTISPECIES: ATP-binding cassette domain-containing protein [Streptomyces]|uniref:ATP-binding cassette domain-containing protein n=1 Tax=Streptomyces siderophoricus TaxID=2802281 RepID=A0ABS1MV89_9ACTN|nr:ATP-binding cassette domain-containing protein [Streptomyces sp. 9-7]MBL1091715.1 ATP-binding cassette domain-containing protein [Streptomyces sp. 9-7]
MFEGVDLDVPAGGLLAVHGPAGSGRTSLLLALAGRMRLSGGAVRVGGYVLPAEGRRVRAAVAVARAAPAVALEGRLRVQEVMAERRLTGAGVTERRIREALETVGIGPRGTELVEDLDPVEALLLATALALAERPGALVVDDVDDGLPPEAHGRVWQALDQARNSGPGCTVLAGCLRTPPPISGLVTLSLPRRSRDRLPARTAAAREDNDT